MHNAHIPMLDDMQGNCPNTDQFCIENNLLPSYAGMTDLERLEVKIDKLAAAVDDIVKVVSNVVDGLDNNPMMKAMGKMFGKGN